MSVARRNRETPHGARAGVEDGDGVSYETLQELLRQERRSNKMTPVRNGFWSQLQQFLRDVEGEFRTAQQEDPWSRRAMMMRDRVINARHAAQTVWALRERKLAILALANAEEGQRPDGLTAKETELYDKLLATLREGRTRVFEGTPAAPKAIVSRPPAPQVPRSRAKEDPPAAAGDAPAPEAEQDDEPRAPRPRTVPPDAPADDLVTIRALGEIPPFVGPDMDTYHLKEGDLASVPPNIAELLVRRGKAAVVEAA